MTYLRYEREDFDDRCSASRIVLDRVLNPRDYRCICTNFKNGFDILVWKSVDVLGFHALDGVLRSMVVALYLLQNVLFRQIG